MIAGQQPGMHGITSTAGGIDPAMQQTNMLFGSNQQQQPYPITGQSGSATGTSLDGTAYTLAGQQRPMTQPFGTNPAQPGIVAATTADPFQQQQGVQPAVVAAAGQLVQQQQMMMQQATAQLAQQQSIIQQQQQQLLMQQQINNSGNADFMQLQHSKKHQQRKMMTSSAAQQQAALEHQLMVKQLNVPNEYCSLENEGRRR